MLVEAVLGESAGSDQHPQSFELSTGCAGRGNEAADVTIALPTVEVDSTADFECQKSFLFGGT